MHVCRAARVHSRALACARDAVPRVPQPPPPLGTLGRVARRPLAGRIWLRRACAHHVAMRANALPGDDCAHLMRRQRAFTRGCSWGESSWLRAVQRGAGGGRIDCHTRATVARVSCDACAMGSLFTCGDCACTPSFEWVLLLVLTSLTVDLVWASLWMCMAAGCGAVDGARADAGSSRAG